MSPTLNFRPRRIRPLVRRFSQLALLPSGLLLALAAGGCHTTPPKTEPGNSAARTELLRQEAVKAEAQRIERLKLAEAANGSAGQAKTDQTQLAGTQNAKIQNNKSAGDGEKGKTKLERAKELSTKMEKATRDLYLAELEHALAKEQAQHEELKAQDGLTKAKFELEHAQQELVTYQRVDAPALLGKQKLSIDKKSFRHEEARQNLEQMREEYSKFETDSVAKRTGEIVIWRSETELDFAQRELGLERLEEKTLTRNTIPHKTAALEAAVAQKKSALRQAQEALARLDFENKLSLSKAGNSVVYKQLELDELREEQAKL